MNIIMKLSTTRRSQVYGCVVSSIIIVVDVHVGGCSRVRQKMHSTCRCGFVAWFLYNSLYPEQEYIMYIQSLVIRIILYQYAF